MQIKDVLRPVANATRSLFEPTARGEAKGGESVEPAPGADTIVDSKRPSSSKLRTILAGYDVSNLAPRDFSELVRQLRDAGEISDGDLKELAALRLELDQAQFTPDEPVDLLGFFQQKLKRLQGQAEQAGESLGPNGKPANAATSNAERQLAWLTKFAALHDGAGEINAWA